MNDPKKIQYIQQKQILTPLVHISMVFMQSAVQV